MRCGSTQRDSTPTPSPASQAYRDLPAVSVSCVLLNSFWFFLAYSLHPCSNLVLAAMKKSVAASAGGSSPAFGSESQDFGADDARYCYVVSGYFQRD